MICLGIRHVQGTTLESAITTNGVNSPHNKTTSAKRGTRRMSWEERARSWNSERVRVPAFAAAVGLVFDLERVDWMRRARDQLVLTFRIPVL